MRQSYIAVLGSSRYIYLCIKRCTFMIYFMQYIEVGRIKNKMLQGKYVDNR